MECWIRSPAQRWSIVSSGSAVCSSILASTNSRVPSPRPKRRANSERRRTAVVQPAARQTARSSAAVRRIGAPPLPPHRLPELPVALDERLQVGDLVAVGRYAAHGAVLGDERLRRLLRDDALGGPADVHPGRDAVALGHRVDAKGGAAGDAASGAAAAHDRGGEEQSTEYGAEHRIPHGE